MLIVNGAVPEAVERLGEVGDLGVREMGGVCRDVVGSGVCFGGLE